MNLHGFTLIYEGMVKELGSLAKIWQHDKTGAQLLSFTNSDENKVFGVSLRTPPHDSTGLPHILEHSVLCGSDKYPVREPFVELLKSSLQTFLNAFTYPDKTCYPVASTNLQDFYNLVDVYLDAVFHPRITEEVFAQEGWHLEAAPASDGSENPDISFKGVVYNEMKGVFSSPEAVLERQSMHALFPDISYGLESGGDPADIPSLTFEDFMAFHRNYYHPSNARFYFWGDDPEERRLELIAELLQGYERSETTASAVPLQQPFAEPQSLRLPFAAGDDDKAMFTLNWVLCANGYSEEEVELCLSLSMLEHILLGMPASPLRRALIESGLGEDLAGSGLEDELRQIIFSIGLKGIDEAKAPEVQGLILSCLEKLSTEGLPEESIEAAINSIEFDLRENNTGRFPVGLSIMLRSLTTWLHKDNPAADQSALADGAFALGPLRFEKPLESIKQKVAQKSSRYFESLIRRYLLDNKHRAAILLYPDKEQASRMAAEEQERLNTKLTGLSLDDKKALIGKTEALHKFQAREDSPEDLAKMPRLELADLPRQNHEIEQRRSLDDPMHLFFHPQATNGITYLAVHLDFSSVPDKNLPLLPMLGRAMLEMGNEQRDFIELNMRIARKTGGMDSGLNLYTRIQDKMPLGGLCVSGKAAPGKEKDLFDLTSEVLEKTNLDNQEHFSRMLLEEKARLEHSLIPAGHQAVSTRLKAGLSLTGWLTEQCSGMRYLESIRELCDQAAKDWPGLLKRLVDTRKTILNRTNTLFSITAEEKMYPMLAEMAQGIHQRLAASSGGPVARMMEELPTKEALLTPSQVNYAGIGVNLYEHGYSYHGSALAIMKYLRTGYLWEKVRVLGGAYGAFCTLDRGTGDLIFASYRDPNIENTLRIFTEAGNFLANTPPEKHELESAIIGAIGEVDSYMLPPARGAAAFARSITGNTSELRAKMRQELLNTTRDDVIRFGQLLQKLLPSANQAVLGGKHLEEYAAKQGWKQTRVL